jgi:hypothetical protein
MYVVYSSLISMTPKDLVEYLIFDMRVCCVGVCPCVHLDGRASWLLFCGRLEVGGACQMFLLLQ